MANEMLETTVSIQPKDSGGEGGETRETVVYRLADDMLEKLPLDFIPHEVFLFHLFIVQSVCDLTEKSMRPI